MTGAAAAVTAQLQAGGLDLQAPINASAEVTTSHVYYVAGQKAAADAIAASLHLPATAVVPVHDRGPGQLHRHGRGRWWWSVRTSPTSSAATTTSTADG